MVLTLGRYMMTDHLEIRHFHLFCGLGGGAAAAIASVMSQTLLLAWSGETFALSAAPIWVRPLALAVATDESGQLELFGGKSE